MTTGTTATARRISEIERLIRRRVWANRHTAAISLLAKDILSEFVDWDDESLASDRILNLESQISDLELDVLETGMILSGQTLGVFEVLEKESLGVPPEAMRDWFLDRLRAIWKLSKSAPARPSLGN